MWEPWSGSASPNFRTPGQAVRQATPLVAQAITAADATGLVTAPRKGEGEVDVEGEVVSLMRLR